MDDDIRPVNFAELARWRDRALAAEAAMELANVELGEQVSQIVVARAERDHARFMAAGWRRLAVEGREAEVAVMAAARAALDTITSERDEAKALAEGALDAQADAERETFAARAEAARMRAVVEAARLVHAMAVERYPMPLHVWPGDLGPALAALDGGDDE